MRQLAVGFVLVTLLATSLALASTSLHPNIPNTQDTDGTPETTDATEGGGGTVSSEGGIAPTALTAVERCNKTKRATTIEWDCSFHDMDYTLGDTLTVAVTWDVLSGAAQYDSFDLKGKGFTPVAKRDPATGELVTVVQTGRTVTFDIRFDELHGNGQGGMGNANLKLYLWVDVDGDGTAEVLAGFGVNLHVEDPA